jgi:hypothetical protein
MAKSLNFCCFLFCFTLMSCISQRPFVATSFEPLMIREKGGISINGNMRPLRYYSVDMTGAVTDFLALRGGLGWDAGLQTYNAHTILFKNYSTFGIYLGAGLFYQHNELSRKPLAFSNTSFTYNCEYYSPDLVAGLNFFSPVSEYVNQLVLKVQYNLATRYKYEFKRRIDYVDENFSAKIPDFISIEFGYALSTRVGKHFSIKFHPGLQYVRQPFVHAYQYKDQNSPQPVTIIETHPKYLGMNVSLGLVFMCNTKGRKRNMSVAEGI